MHPKAARIQSVTTLYACLVLTNVLAPNEARAQGTFCSSGAQETGKKFSSQSACLGNANANLHAVCTSFCNGKGHGWYFTPGKGEGCNASSPSEAFCVCQNDCIIYPGTSCPALWNSCPSANPPYGGNPCTQPYANSSNLKPAGCEDACASIGRYKQWGPNCWNLGNNQYQYACQCVAGQVLGKSLCTGKFVELGSHDPSIAECNTVCYEQFGSFATALCHDPDYQNACQCSNTPLPPPADACKKGVQGPIQSALGCITGCYEYKGQGAWTWEGETCNRYTATNTPPYYTKAAYCVCEWGFPAARTGKAKGSGFPEPAAAGASQKK